MANLNLLPNQVISDCEVNRAFMNEIHNGFQLERATEEARHQSAAQEAAEFRKNNRTVKGLGKIISTMPAREFFRVVEKYGHEEVHSKEFQRFDQKAHPELHVNKV